ncbi:hypothetical protein BpHYR1_037300 [Brachionus plicatilis]|uniref:Uncharacterized protein n=1 Tax=Brachionus plicatilis TaxID=10195 RepID=A0A3M7RY51_BRAPC|nr:hypothetical protein BpHYR1_037300 [Brachionus plicatilis]
MNSEQLYHHRDVDMILITCLTVQGRCELVDGWWHFESFEQDGLLSLQADVSGPSHKTVFQKCSVICLSVLRLSFNSNVNNSSRHWVTGKKFFGRFSNSGLTTFLASCTFAFRGAAAILDLPFLPPLVGFLAAGLTGF